jgi:hypothetical protein
VLIEHVKTIEDALTAMSIEKLPQRPTRSTGQISSAKGSSLRDGDSVHDDTVLMSIPVSSKCWQTGSMVWDLTTSEVRHDPPVDMIIITMIRFKFHDLPV